MNLESLAASASDFLTAMAGVAKCAIRSRRPSPAGPVRTKPLVILANGPSLRQTLAEEGDLLRESLTMAVNFAANTPDFHTLRPDFYTMVDPHFFRSEESDPNVRRLWENLAKTNWPMTLFLPANMRREISHASGNPVSRLPQCVTLRWINLTPAEGWKPLAQRLYRAGLAMPRPRNVLIASLMAALREGFREIVIAGADHTWTRDLWVDDRNRVISVQPHFYKDNEKELDRVAQEYAGIPLHRILGSMTVAFRSYHLISGYAESLGASIVNATPGSFIDAFPRAATVAEAIETIHRNGK